MINIRRPSTDHRPGRVCRCVLRPPGQKDERKCKHPGYPVNSMCQVCNRHSCGNPDCDSSIYVDEEHFGLRCATCWYGPPNPPTFYKVIHACQHTEMAFYERYGPDYKEGDPEVVDGRYVAGEPRVHFPKRSVYFCESDGTAWSLNGETIWGRHSKREAQFWSDLVRFRPGHTPITWDVCEPCKKPVYKSIRRYEERLFKEYELREKEYNYQRKGLREGRKILTAVKRLLKEKKETSTGAPTMEVSEIRQATRRFNGGGTIKNRADGRREAAARVPMPSGKHKRISVYAPKGTTDAALMQKLRVKVEEICPPFFS